MSVPNALGLLNDSIIRYRGEPVGTSAACDPNPVAANYTDCFVRDFVPSALVFLMRGETAIVRNFLTTVMQLRGQQQVLEGHSRSRGLMPASFKVVTGDGEERLEADFGDRARDGWTSASSPRAICWRSCSIWPPRRSPQRSWTCSSCTGTSSWAKCL